MSIKNKGRLSSTEGTLYSFPINRNKGKNFEFVCSNEQTHYED